MPCLPLRETVIVVRLVSQFDVKGFKLYIVCVTVQSCTSWLMTFAAKKIAQFVLTAAYC